MIEGISTRRILLVAQRPSDFVEMRRCAFAFRAIGWSCIVLYFGQGAQKSEIVEMETELSELRRLGILDSYVFLGPETPSNLKFTAPTRAGRGLLGDEFKRRPVVSIVRKAVLKVDSWVDGTLRKQVARLLAVVFRWFDLFANGARVLRYYFDEQESIGKIVADVRPDAIVLPEDVVGLVTPLVIRAGHLQNIPSIIIPYTIANQQEAFKSLRSNPSYRGSHWANWVAALIFPKWKMSQDGAALVRLPAPYILGHELTSTSPPDPWMMNSGFANAIAIENDAMLDFYLSSGLPRNKMHVVGAIYDDYLAKFKSDKSVQLQHLREELNLANDKPLLLVGGCPDQSGSCPPGFEFPSMDDFVKRLSVSLQSMEPRYQVVLRPHPNFFRMAEVAAEHGILCTTIDTARLVALSDVYLAFGSATIRWAISCGVPAINYDVFHYNYSDYKDVGGVIHVNKFAQLTDVFSSFLSSPEFARGLEREIGQSLRRWGQLDGKSTERIALLIEQVCNRRPVLRTAE